MAWFHRTLAGKLLLPLESKVKNILKEHFEYEVNYALEPVFKAFVEEQKINRYNEYTIATLFMAVVINAINEDESTEKKDFVSGACGSAIDLIPHYNIEIEYVISHMIDATSKHLSADEITLIWDLENPESFLSFFIDYFSMSRWEKIKFLYFEKEE